MHAINRSVFTLYVLVQVYHIAKNTQGNQTTLISTQDNPKIENRDRITSAHAQYQPQTPRQLGR